MANHDYVIANGTGSAVRADINSALQAITTTNSGNSAPSTVAAGMLWWDSDGNTLYIRNTANDAWVPVSQRRNIIINGACNVSQRATTTAAITAAGYHTLDRYYTTMSDSGTMTMTQTADGPPGFLNCLRYDCTTADASVAAGARMMQSYRIEGQDLQGFKKGTSSAQSFTVSFWVKSNLTGAAVVELYDHDNSRQTSKLYTISSSNTWEYKTLTFPGDTTGAFGDDNGKSLELQFYLCAGSNYTSGTRQESWAGSTNANRAAGQAWQLSSSTSNDWSITGLQLEIGENASPFEYKSFGEELALCQRYCTKIAPTTTNAGVATGFARTTTTMYAARDLPVHMRTTPTLTFSGNTDFQIQYLGSTATTTAMAASELSADTISFQATVASGLTAGQGMYLRDLDGGSSIIASAEL